MSQAERLKWESRYCSSSHLRTSFAPPSSWLMKWASGMPLGKALDLAMGLGSNAIYLASLGFQVYGIDISLSGVQIAKKRALSSSLRVNAIVADLDVYPLRPNYFNLVVDCYYLNKALFPEIKTSLKPEGVVIIETYVEDSVHKLVNPGYLLKPKELLQAFCDFDVLAYEETQPNPWADHPGQKRIAQICARSLKPGFVSPSENI
jgi:tellurite methyltransferase